MGKKRNKRVLREQANRLYEVWLVDRFHWDDNDTVKVFGPAPHQDVEQEYNKLTAEGTQMTEESDALSYYEIRFRLKNEGL